MTDSRNLQQFVGGQIAAIRMSGGHGEVLHITLYDGRRLYVASKSEHEVGVGLVEEPGETGMGYTEL